MYAVLTKSPAFAGLFNIAFFYLRQLVSMDYGNRMKRDSFAVDISGGILYNKEHKVIKEGDMLEQWMTLTVVTPTEKAIFLFFIL